jgi:hypothetical protein
MPQIQPDWTRGCHQHRVAPVGFLKNIKQGLEAARNFDPATLPPEQREAYEAAMAESRASHAQAVAINDEARILEGPAGEYLYGVALRDMDPMSLDVGEMLKTQMKGFKGALRQTLNRDEVEQESDPVERERIATAERAARAEARAPFRAPGAQPVEISRLATRGETQLQELVAYLGSSGLAAQPERVWGVYRVPDRISQALTPHSEKGRVVEWDVVHRAGTGSPAAPPELTSFSAADRWAGRRVGDRSLLDEDLGLAFLAGAGIGPERCLGLARYCEFRAVRGGGSEDHNPIHTLVRGLVAVHPDGAHDTYERMRGAAPIAVPEEPAGIVCELLNWEEVARAVRPKINHPYPVPSPFSYLPSSPQELLRAYLEVVGVQPHDCYSAQATVSWGRELIQGGLMTTNLGPKQPCADGKPRMRSHGCQQVVIVYRDTPAYAEGRERWARYEREVLQAGLRKGIVARPRISDPDDMSGVPRGLRTITRVAEVVDRVWEADWGGEDLPPYRYCSPPVA